MKNYFKIGLFCVILSLPLAGCIGQNQSSELKKASAKEPEASPPQPQNTAEKTEETPTENTSPETNSTANPSPKESPAGGTNGQDTVQNEGIQVVSAPESIPVLVNKHNKLPDTYEPADLVYTDIPFVFQEMTDKRKLRAEAAAAINNLFAAANSQGISLLGVSGYRSHATQTSLFNYYVKKDGYEKARTYSALPGTSEHETGLAIDVTGGDGKCPAQDCFGGTPEANWLQEHAAEFGFIIRYPQGKEAITGYKYEPWHLRYVGKEIALEIMDKGITLEEYFGAVPVSM